MNREMFFEKCVCPRCGSNNCIYDRACCLSSIPAQFKYKCSDCGAIGVITRKDDGSTYEREEDKNRQPY